MYKAIEDIHAELDIEWRDKVESGYIIAGDYGVLH